MFDYNLLKQFLTFSKDELANYAIEKGFVQLGDKNIGHLLYKDNGSKILAVAHIDHHDNDYERAFMIDDNTIEDIRLDDRLGVYTLFKYENKYNWDILLTDFEEPGNSTAQFFGERIATPKNYNWMVEFDRRGDTIVLYKYDNEVTKSVIEKIGGNYGKGSRSDISYLDYLGVCGFNFGVGYYNEHNDDCHMKIDVYHKQMEIFDKFYKAFKDIKFPYPMPQDFVLD